MRIGLIADIHGNAWALRTALSELSAAGVDDVVCLGDVAVLGPEPGDVLRLLNEVNCVIVRGNTDAWLLDEPSDAIPPSPGPSQDLLDWTKVVLTPEELSQLREYPMTLDYDLGAGTMLRCAHGSPRSFEDVIGPRTPAEEILDLIGTPTPAVAAGGHTHIQMVRRIGGTIFVNPGSVGLPGVGPDTEGLPVNQNVAWAEFAIVDVGERGLGVELRRAPLDVAEMIIAAKQRDMPHLDWWRARWE